MKIVFLAVSVLVAGSFDVWSRAEEGYAADADVLREQTARPQTTRPLRDESVQSSALDRAMNYRVLLPEGYGTSPRRYPVLYLLHGIAGDYTDWTSRTNVAEYSRRLPLIIVMPDGGNEWYTNAADGSAAYED